MGARSGGGASGGMGRSAQSYITLQGGKFGSVKINAKKSPQQVLSQANKLIKNIKQTTGGMTFNSLTEIGLYGKTKVQSWGKVFAAQKASQIAKKLGKS